MKHFGTSDIRSSFCSNFRSIDTFSDVENAGPPSTSAIYVRPFVALS
ncbi:uncharacterized protein METZ01_LOCUS7564 [marine metagenome]|uniref:Uncharacterized protein n=1 Tax=marine metagenome TaxID=408172 RepID=A0A381NJH8_9ZZZZ